MSPHGDASNASVHNAQREINHGSSHPLQHQKCNPHLGDRENYKPCNLNDCLAKANQSYNPRARVGTYYANQQPLGYYHQFKVTNQGYSGRNKNQIHNNRYCNSTKLDFALKVNQNDEHRQHLTNKQKPSLHFQNQNPIKFSNYDKSKGCKNFNNYHQNLKYSYHPNLKSFNYYQDPNYSYAIRPKAYRPYYLKSNYHNPIVCSYCLKFFHSRQNCFLLRDRLRYPNDKFCTNCKRRSHLNVDCRSHPMEGVQINPKDRIKHKNCAYCSDTRFQYKEQMSYDHKLTKFEKSPPQVNKNSQINHIVPHDDKHKQIIKQSQLTSHNYNLYNYSYPYNFKAEQRYYYKYNNAAKSEIIERNYYPVKSSKIADKNLERPNNKITTLFINKITGNSKSSNTQRPNQPKSETLANQRANKNYTLLDLLGKINIDINNLNKTDLNINENDRNIALKKIEQLTHLMGKITSIYKVANKTKVTDNHSNNISGQSQVKIVKRLSELCKVVIKAYNLKEQTLTSGKNLNQNKNPTTAVTDHETKQISKSKVKKLRELCLNIINKNKIELQHNTSVNKYKSLPTAFANVENQNLVYSENENKVSAIENGTRAKKNYLKKGQGNSLYNTIKINKLKVKNKSKSQLNKTHNNFALKDLIAKGRKEFKDNDEFKILIYLPKRDQKSKIPICTVLGPSGDLKEKSTENEIIIGGEITREKSNEIKNFFRSLIINSLENNIAQNVTNKIMSESDNKAKSDFDSYKINERRITVKLSNEKASQNITNKIIKINTENNESFKSTNEIKALCKNTLDNIIEKSIAEIIYNNNQNEKMNLCREIMNGIIESSFGQLTKNKILKPNTKLSVNETGTKKKSKKVTKNKKIVNIRKENSQTETKNESESQCLYDIDGNIEFVKIAKDFSAEIRKRKVNTAIPKKFFEYGSASFNEVIREIDEAAEYRLYNPSVGDNIMSEIYSELKENPLEYGLADLDSHKMYWEEVKRENAIVPICFLHIFANIRNVNIYLYYGAPKPLLFKTRGEPIEDIFLQMIDNTYFRMLQPKDMNSFDGVLSTTYEINNIKFTAHEMLVLPSSDMEVKLINENVDKDKKTENVIKSINEGESNSQGVKLAGGETKDKINKKGKNKKKGKNREVKSSNELIGETKINITHKTETKIKSEIGPEDSEMIFDMEGTVKYYIKLCGWNWKLNPKNIDTNENVPDGFELIANPEVGGDSMLTSLIYANMSSCVMEGIQIDSNLNNYTLWEKSIFDQMNKHANLYGIEINARKESYWMAVKRGTIPPPLVFIQIFANLSGSDVWMYYENEGIIIFICKGGSRRTTYIRNINNAHFQPMELVSFGKMQFALQIMRKTVYQINNIKIKNEKIIVWDETTESWKSSECEPDLKELYESILRNKNMSVGN